MDRSQQRFWNVTQTFDGGMTTQNQSNAIQGVLGIDTVEHLTVTLQLPDFLPVPTGSLEIRAAQYKALAAPEAKASNLAVSNASIVSLLTKAAELCTEISRRNLQRAELLRETCFESQLAQRINQWLAAPAKPLCYLEYHAKHSASIVDMVAACAQIVRTVQAANCTALLHAQAQPQMADTGSCYEDSNIIYTMLSIAKDIFHLLPENGEQVSPVWAKFDQEKSTKPIQFAKAIELFGAALSAAPANLYIVIAGYPALWLVSEAHARDFLSTLREATSSAESKTRCIIITERKLSTLLQSLQPNEITNITSSPKATAPKTQIILRRPVGS